MQAIQTRILVTSILMMIGLVVFPKVQNLFTSEETDVMDFGAKGDGITDDSLVSAAQVYSVYIRILHPTTYQIKYTCNGTILDF